MSLGCEGMTKDLFAFLRKNNINDVKDFVLQSDFKIEEIERNISNMELNHGVFSKIGEETIPLSQILGFSKSDCKIDKSFFANFDNFFNSTINDGYHTRALGMLSYSPEDVMDFLARSFSKEPIKTISINNQYYISSNGLHRFMALKLYYMLEMYQGKSIEELDKKYMIKVENKELDIFKTFTNYFGSCFNPPIQYGDSTSQKDWLNEVKMRMESFNEMDYNLLISTFSFSHFINDTSGEIMIKCLFEYFPNFSLDVFKHLVITGNYDRAMNFVSCIKKYFPNYEAEVLSIVNNNNMNFDLQNNNVENDFEYFDLNQQWNDYGTVKDISNIARNSRQFSEGSEALEKCLQIIWEQNIATTSCCKGNHLSINVDNKPEVNCEAYISFGDNQEWQSYLSQEIIENSDVIIQEHAIYYYGANSEAFFRLLGRDFITGKKNNKTFLENKNNVVTDVLEYKSFIISLQQIGFDEEQISYLSNGYLEINKLMNAFYSSENVDKETIRQKWHEAKQRYDADLIFYIDRNNQSISQKSNL